MFGPNKRTLKVRIEILESALAATDNALARSREERVKLQEELQALSRTKDPQHSVGALAPEVYKAKVLDKIGNTYLSATDSAEYKLGIQHALRHFEKEVVIGQ